jgi:hypothetical protein
MAPASATGGGYRRLAGGGFGERLRCDSACMLGRGGLKDLEGPLQVSQLRAR